MGRSDCDSAWFHVHTSVVTAILSLPRGRRPFVAEAQLAQHWASPCKTKKFERTAHFFGVLASGKSSPQSFCFTSHTVAIGSDVAATLPPQAPAQ